MRKQKYCSKADLYDIIKNVIISLFRMEKNEADSNRKTIGC